MADGHDLIMQGLSGFARAYQSQKDGVMFQGDDSREFWMRAEERNRDTANKYKAMGLSSYAAMEAFVRHKFN